VKAINPFYILGASALLLLFFMIGSWSTKAELHALHTQNAELKKEISTIMALKREFSDPKKRKRDLQRLLQNRLIKSSVTSQTLTNAKAEIVLDGLGEAGAKWFIQKLFNDKFRIKKLDIKRTKEATLTIKTEVLF
jgi:hypothetical protein